MKAIEFVRELSYSPETARMILSVGGLFISLSLFGWFIYSLLVKGKKSLEFRGAVLPPVKGLWRRGFLLLLALLLFVPSAWGAWCFFLCPVPTLTVWTGLSSEELEVFGQAAKLFEEAHNHKVRVIYKNVDKDSISSKLTEKDGDVDLITFDINVRCQLVDTNLIKCFSEEEYKELIPSSVNPVLLKHLDVNGLRYFMPFRPNVQIVFWNKDKFEDAGIKAPKTWQEVKKVAQKFHKRDGEPRVVIQAHKGDVHLTLYQLICSAGGDPFNLHDPNTLKALKFLITLQPYVLPKSSEVNWQTASGFLLTDSVYLARNWSFSASMIDKAGRNEEFKTSSGWSWGDRSNPFNLLGGEFFALPENTPHGELAIEFMRFLMSRDIQERFANELIWPAIRLDAMGGIQSWQKGHQVVINRALNYAHPLPEHWTPRMSVIYRKIFERLAEVKDPKKSDTQLNSIVDEFQKKISEALEDKPDAVVAEAQPLKAEF